MAIVVKKLTILLVVLFACVGCDQATKYTARHYLEDKGTISFASDMLRLDYSENTGAFLGLGSTLPEQLRTFIFSGLVAVSLFGFSVYVITKKTMSRVLILASALIIGGGVSNLLDRLTNEGAVVDFLNLGIGSLRTGIFNIADMTIMLGACLFFLYSRNKYS